MISKKKAKMYAKFVKLLGSQSTCDRANVGSLILKDDRIVSTGYNGSLPGQPHCDDSGHLLIDGHCINTIHSEMNCLMFCTKEGIATKDCDIIVSHSPCPICTKLLIQAGIKNIYYVEAYRLNENPFKDIANFIELK